MKKDNSEKDLLFVSIVIPCRNEEKMVGKCLDSIINQHYPKDKLEVLVIDGLSTDKTMNILDSYAKKFKFIRILQNERKITPCAMNIGIKNSIGNIVILVNAHCILDNSFIINNINGIMKTNADAVGGMLNAINEGNSLIGISIPLSTNSYFGSGGRRYRSRLHAGFVRDTLPYCSYRRELFDKLGYIDEDLIRDQDEEFNYRILRSGGKIYYMPQIKSYLYIRPTLKKLWKQHYQYGYYKPLVIKKVGGLFTWRQAIPSLMIISLIIAGLLALISNFFYLMENLILGSYLLLNFSFSGAISIKKNIKLFPFLVASFAALHFSYGIGYLKGVWDFIIYKKNLTRMLYDMDLTR